MLMLSDPPSPSLLPSGQLISRHMETTWKPYACSEFLPPRMGPAHSHRVND